MFEVKLDVQISLIYIIFYKSHFDIVKLYYERYNDVMYPDIQK